jgi:hypothetical protein
LLIEKEGLNTAKRKVGFILCGWNFTQGPFDKEQREFAEAVEYISEDLDLDFQKSLNLYMEEITL